MWTLAQGIVFGSVTYARQANGSHVHRIDGYSLLQQTCSTGDVLKSAPFRAGGRKWELLLYPNGVDKDHRGFVSANLRLSYKDNSWSDATATYRVSILDITGSAAHSSTVGPWCCLERSDNWKNGINKLVAVEEVLRSAPFLRKNDCLDIQCDVSVLKTDGKPRRRWFML